MAAPRPRRSWLFVPGADPIAHTAAARSGADVIILELEDFTPPELRPRARQLSRKVFVPLTRLCRDVCSLRDVGQEIGAALEV